MASCRRHGTELPRSDCQGLSDSSGTGSPASSLSDVLEQGVTTIILRRLPTHLTIEMLVQLLHSAVPGQYDFVYLPYGRRKERNVALAFINFTSHMAALRASAFLSAAQGEGRAPLQISPARVQGLGPNLAYFVARFGFQELSNPHAPRVYDHRGRALDTVTLICQHVDMAMLTDAKKILQEEAEVLLRRQGGAAIVDARRSAKLGGSMYIVKHSAAPGTNVSRKNSSRCSQLGVGPIRVPSPESSGEPSEEETAALLQKVQFMQREQGYAMFEL